MDATKEHLIKKLLKEGKISEDDANVLRRKEEMEVQYIPTPPINPFPPIGQQPYKKQDWITDELNKRARIAASCGCNPANGGSGVCGCVLTGSFTC